MDYGQKVRELREQYPFDTSNVNAIFNFTRRVAWELRAEGFGLMEKSYGGENEVEYKGTKYSLSRIATRDRHYKILTDAGPNGANGATWVDEGPLPDRAGVSFKPALPPDGVDGPIVEIPADDDRVAALERAFQTMGEVFQRFVGTVAEKISRQDEKIDALADAVSKLEAAAALPPKPLKLKASTSRVWGHAHEINVEVTPNE